MKFVGERSLGSSIFGTGVDAGHLIGSQCPVCGDVRFPPRPICPIDLNATHPLALSTRGVVYAAVLVRLAPAGFDAPYWAGFIDLPEGVRVFARIATDDPEHAPVNGDPVTLTVEEMGDETNHVLGPVFRKAKVDASN